MPKHKHHREKKIVLVKDDYKTLSIPLHVLTDKDANVIIDLWQREFKDAAILPVIGFPSHGKGVMTFTHTMGDGKVMSFNGLKSNSPLSNNALGSFEFTGGKFLSIYEIMIPDIPGTDGNRSTAQIYIDELANQGLQVNAAHYHFLGAQVYPQDKGMTAVHHTSTTLDPVAFTVKTIAAIKAAMAAIAART